MKLVGSVFVLVGGCVLPNLDPTSDDACDRRGYLSLIGTNIAAVTLPASEDIRAFAESDLVTQDFVQTRTNLVYDANGTIIRVYCG